jgi:nitroreductase
MDAKEAIAAAKRYVNDIYADEHVTNLGLEEIEHILAAGNWVITLGFSRPWNTPRTRAQEVLENLGAVSSLKRSYKVITMADDGMVLSMKNRAKADAAE